MNLVEQQTMIVVENLGKRFGAQWVFRHLEFDLSLGDCLLVLGSNGSGKSTLLRVLAGLEQQTEGNRRLRTATNDDRLAIGYSSPEMRLYPNLTSAEHLNLAASLRGLPNPKNLLEQVGLSKSSDKLTSELSTGMRARLRLALALQSSPPILLLDEPGLGLDEYGSQLVEDIAKEQSRKGVLILATNDNSERRFGNLEIRMAN